MSPTLKDHFEPTLWPLLHLKPAFDYPDGIFSPLQRLLLQKSEGLANEIEVSTSSGRNESFYESYLAKRHNINLKVKTKTDPAEQPLTPAALLENFPRALESDLAFLSRENYPRPEKPLCHIQGSLDDLWIGPGAEISPMAAIDTTSGPVVIETGATVGPFCLLKGPLYLARDCRIDNAHIAQSRIGQAARIGGEVGESLIGDFSNKHHEGFLGHSLVGEWANLGALTTTSDLKNNYGIIKLKYQNTDYSTGVIKFGSIIGDFSKTAIGSMLNTGTIIDAGANLFEGRSPQKYYPPFFWGGEEPSRYELKRFLNDMSLIMKRRDKKPGEFETRQITLLHEEN